MVGVIVFSGKKFMTSIRHSHFPFDSLRGSPPKRNECFEVKRLFYVILLFLFISGELDIVINA